MAGHERANQGRNEEVDQKHRLRQQDSEPLSEKSLGWDQGPLSLTETPFYPRVDEHAEVLSKTPFAAQRYNFIMLLHQTYGNRYVQRLMESMKAQSKLTVSAPNDIYEHEADRVAEAFTGATRSPVQYQETPAEEKEIQTNAEESEARLNTNMSRDFEVVGSHIPIVQREPMTNSYTSDKPEEGPGPVSTDGPSTPPAPAPPAAPAAPPTTISTKTLASAPDGTPNTRTEVGVNEEVEMTASGKAKWTATSGKIAPEGTTVTWTAPATAGNSTVTATPAEGSASSVSMTVVSPRERLLVKKTDRSYDAGKAGSGFVADVTIAPTNVSFSRIEVREGSVNAVATGYYKTTLSWDGITHPTGSWVAVNSNNSGLIDTVGTRPPGSSGPFSAGDFLWDIPQNYRITGSSGDGTEYSKGSHRQVMAGTNGEEATSKEGASRSRTP